jgi:hypothetical protein
MALYHADMRRLVSTAVVWLIVGALIAFPIVYSVHHWSSSSFRDGAVGSWLGTALGVIVGLPTGLALERLRERAVRKGRQHSLGHLVYRELEFNSGLVALLEEALAQLPKDGPVTKAGPDFWNWAEALISGIKLETYRELGATLMPEERVFYAQVLNSYDSLWTLASTVRQSKAKNVLLLASGNEGEASNLVIGAQARSEMVLSQIKDAIEELKKAP